MDEHRVLTATHTLKLLRHRVLANRQTTKRGEATGRTGHLATKHRRITYVRVRSARRGIG